MSIIPVPANLEMINSVGSQKFPINAFLAIQKEQMGHTVTPEQICQSKSIMFGIPHENVLAYVAMIDAKICGVSYLWTRNLTNADSDLIFVETQEGLLLTPINKAISTAFNHPNKSIYELEFGGTYVDKEQRGKGIYSKLFDQRVQTISAIQNGEFQLLNGGETVATENVFTTLTAKGPHSDNSKLAEIKKQMKAGDVLSFEKLSEIGIQHKTIGDAREESQASKHIAEKKTNMQLIGFSSNNLGPIYALPLLKFGKK